MARRIFVTGTDTDVGKTYIATKLLRQFSEAGFSTLGIKPIASGCDLINGELINADTLSLSAAASIKTNYNIINPIAFAPPIAPHIAANLINYKLDVAILAEKLRPALDIHADITIIEGSGGWLLPLNKNETLADYVIQQGFEIILVVGMRLGCLNHAALTEQSIIQAGGKLIGWIANCIDLNMEYVGENITALKNILQSPHLNTFYRLK